MEKTERYSWTMTGNGGYECLIAIGKLNVDHSYQRGEVSESNILAMARNFNLSVFGRLSVMQRDDGSFWVVDGQQRLAAARRRGDIVNVPCIVIKSDGPNHEAEIFYKINKVRSRVSALDKYRASVMIGEGNFADIDDWLKNNGFDVKKSHGHASKNSVDFVESISKCWKSNEEAAKNALVFHRNINMEEEQMCKSIFEGCWILFKNGIMLFEHENKIRMEGGKVAIIQRMKSLKIGMASSQNLEICGQNAKFASLAILQIINKGKRKKISIDPSN